jgi:hypothetical protein
MFILKQNEKGRNPNNYYGRNNYPQDLQYQRETGYAISGFS